MKNKLFIPLILCVLAACNNEAEYSGKVETQQDLADCYKAGDHALVDYLNREGQLVGGDREVILAYDDLVYDDDWYLEKADDTISVIMINPVRSETFARGQLDLFASREWIRDAWEATCHLAYITGEEVDWPNY